MPARKLSIGGAFIGSLLSSGGIIITSLITGILTARMLGTDGRGEVAAVSSWLLTLTWLSSFGFSLSMTYHQSKRLADDGAVLGTALLSVPVLGLVGVLIAQLAIPFGFAAQTEETQRLARIFLCGIPLVLGTETMWGQLMGQQRFRELNLMRLTQPALYALTIVILAISGHVTPTSVLTSQVATYAVTFAGGVVFVWRHTPAARRPSMALARKGIGYGLRLQGAALGQLITTRLDLMLLPAFVAAASVGYYAISVNVASMVTSLFGGLALIVFPVATRQDGKQLHSVVERGLRLALIGGGACVLVLAVTAPWLIPFVYGPGFEGSIRPLWMLLPGILMWCCNSILGAGLQARGRPGAASLAQIAGVIVPVAGLAITLPRIGIEGAAITSSAAYTITVLISMALLRRHGGLSVRKALSPARVGADLTWLVGRVRNRGASAEPVASSSAGNEPTTSAKGGIDQ